MGKSLLLETEALRKEPSQIDIKKSKKKKKSEEEGIDGDAIQIMNEKSSVNEQLTLNFSMEVINDRTDRTPPIVGYFPSRYDPLKNIGSGGSAVHNEGPSIRFYRNEQRIKIEKSTDEKSERRRGSERLELVVSPPGANVEFVGTSYKGEAMAAQLSTYALGVLDKETQTLKIMPIAGNKIFRLEPKLRQSDVANKEPSCAEVVEPTEEQRKSKRKETTQRYGTKSSIRKDKKAEALKLGDNPSAEMDMSRKISFVPVNEEALQSTSADIARNIPPHNTSANTAQEAYPLDRIILTREWDVLGDIFEALRTGAEVTSSAYPTFVCNRIHKLHGIQDEEKRKTLSCIFSYITHLIKFKEMHFLDRHSSVKHHRFPSILRQKFAEIFKPESESKRLDPEKTNLLVSYVLVLSLHVDDFWTNPADIAKDLKINLPTIRNHFENLGCKLVREKNLTMATLPVPLKFPKMIRKRKR